VAWTAAQRGVGAVGIDRTRTGERRGEGCAGNGSVAGDDASYTPARRCEVKPSFCFAEPAFGEVLRAEVAGGFGAMGMSEVFPWLLLN